MPSSVQSPNFVRPFLLSYSLDPSQGSSLLTKPNMDGAEGPPNLELISVEFKAPGADYSTEVTLRRQRYSPGNGVDPDEPRMLELVDEQRFDKDRIPPILVQPENVIYGEIPGEGKYLICYSESRVTPYCLGPFNEYDAASRSARSAVRHGYHYQASLPEPGPLPDFKAAIPVFGPSNVSGFTANVAWQWRQETWSTDHKITLL